MIRPETVSVIDPVSEAIEKTKWFLFKPFDLGKWFVAGFCAWLATLLEQSGGGGSFNWPGRYGRSGMNRPDFEGIKNAVLEHLGLIISVGAIVLFIGLLLGILLLWLTSRGKFMWLHCAARNVAEVAEPWKRYKTQANSLFVFRLVLWLISFLIMLSIFVGLCFVIYPMIVQEQFLWAMLWQIIGLSAIIIIAGIIFGLIAKFTFDFVVPVMYISGESCVAAWRRFMGLLSANKARFVLYILFQIVIGMACGAIIFAVMLLTCCVACCIFSIPYIGTVAMLPILAFNRLYSLCYLKQFGPEFDAFTYLQTKPIPAENPANKSGG